MRPGLLVLLPIVACAPVAAVVLGTGSAAGASAPQAPTSVSRGDVSPSELALPERALVATRSREIAPQVAVQVAVPSPTRVASSAKPAARTRAVVVRRAAAPRTVAATTAPTTAPSTKPAASATPTAAKPAPVRTGRDDYPYRTATTNSYDDWGFTKRQCVSFAAWRLAQAGRALDNRADGWGSASNWDDTARRLGKAVTTKPAVGTVAHWQAGESSAYYAPGSATANGRYNAGSYGHVGWVTHVFADGSVQVEAYNGSGDRSWSTMRVKAPRFLRL